MCLFSSSLFCNSLIFFKKCKVKMTTLPQRRIRPTPRKDEGKLSKIAQDKSHESIAQCRVKALTKTSNAWRNWMMEMAHLYFHFMTRYVEQQSTGISIGEAIVNAQMAAKTFAEFDGMQPHLQLNNMIFQIIERHLMAWIECECENDIEAFVKKYLLVETKKKTSAWSTQNKFQEMLQDLYANVPEPRTYARQLSTALKRKRAITDSAGKKQKSGSSDDEPFRA